MKILIIGAHGQLGTDCTTLLSSGHDVIGYDVPDIDITDRDSTRAIIKEQQPDCIINCAAFTAVDECEKQLERSWDINCVGADHLAREAELRGSRLIHVSTDYVFDGMLPAPNAYGEDAAPNPLSQYGRSKLAGEKAVENICHNHLILRTAWLYSAHGPNFLKTMLRLAIADGNRELKVVDDQYGSLSWSYTLARQIEALLATDMRGIVHTTSEGYSTWYEAAVYFLDRMGIPHNIVPCTSAEYPTPAHRPANSILANNRLQEAGISVFTDWKEDVDTFVTLHKEALLAEARNANH